jgi:uncharacterized protein YfaT (DUF1175 family)
MAEQWTSNDTNGVVRLVNNDTLKSWSTELGYSLEYRTRLFLGAHDTVIPLSTWLTFSLDYMTQLFLGDLIISTLMAEQWTSNDTNGVVRLVNNDTLKC